MAVTLRSEHACFGGTVGFYSHESAVTGTEMNFSVFLPPHARSGAQPAALPTLTYLAGLTCTEETFMIKAGAQRLAADYGLMLVCPDTSPRRVAPAEQDGDWDFGSGAGFYLDATVEPWSRHFRMYSYVTQELPALIAAEFPADPARQSIFGHSMGGHGALISALKNPGTYRSVSAFAPIAAPLRCPWGEKAFTGYLGEDRSAWTAYDASELVKQAEERLPLLIDQGSDDQFLETQLNPELFEAACAEAGHPLELRRQPGYDHGYYFISTFMADHLAHHAKALGLI
ncbi:S-formylglutathione hydrolase [Algihabitans albus]|uniref:S-formylglutathione hydrolase n=1 Tax=Algihabitans albus TaxID=2164067 RepID=UPI000E5DA009|nr:S-formylglutathione hydrolase [Algihabitans albus]